MAVRSKIRLYDLAKELKVNTKRLIDEVRREGVDVSVPSNSISKELADKIRNRYLPKKTTLDKRKIKPLHKPSPKSETITGKLPIRRIQFKGPLPKSKAPLFQLEYAAPTRPTALPRRQKHQKSKRTCPMCGAERAFKSEIRKHYATDHMDEIIRGRFVCKVKVAELAQALKLTEHLIREFAQRTGVKIRGGSYIQADKVKPLAAKIQRSVARQPIVKLAEALTRQQILWRTIARSKPETNRLSATTLKCRLLPQGEYPFQKIETHFHDLERRSRQFVLDKARLRKLNSLRPDRIYIGMGEFAGYVGFSFGQKTVFDCPVIDNAIYVFGENWKTLCRLTKAQLLNGRRSEFKRIVHKGNWFYRLKLEINR
jgi:hypothetical protein